MLLSIGGEMFSDFLGGGKRTFMNPRFVQPCMIFFVAATALLVAACGRVPDEAVDPRADIELFSREGCPRCDEAKRWLSGLRARRPEGTIVVTDVADPVGRRRFVVVAERAGTGAVSVPAFWVRGKLIVGFAGPTTTGVRIEALLADAESAATVPHDNESATCSVDAEQPCD